MSEEQPTRSLAVGQKVIVSPTGYPYYIEGVVCEVDDNGVRLKFHADYAVFDGWYPIDWDDDESEDTHAD